MQGKNHQPYCRLCGLSKWVIIGGGGGGFSAVCRVTGVLYGGLWFRFRV